MKLLLAWACLFVLVHTGTVAGSDVQKYNANGVVCYKCPPGTYVQEHCTENFSNSTCLPCGVHEFMDVWNDLPYCNLCVLGNCPKNGEEVQACTPTTKRLCMCQPGFHRYPIDPYDPHFKCNAHNPCKAGHGIVSHGNHTHDTECETCLVGQQFVNASDKNPRCQECSVCPLGVQVVTECNLTADTVCDNSTQTNATTPDPLHRDGGKVPKYFKQAIVSPLLKKNWT